MIIYLTDSHFYTPSFIENWWCWSTQSKILFFMKYWVLGSNTIWDVSAQKSNSVFKEKMLSGRGKYDKYVFVNEKVLERLLKKRYCVRITFGTTLKIAGKTGFLVFCIPHYFHKILSNPKVIVIFRPLGIASTNWRNLRVCLGGVPPPPLNYIIIVDIDIIVSKDYKM